MSTKRTLLLISILLIVNILILTGCDLFISDDPATKDIALINEFELTRFDKIFQMNQYKATFIIEDIEEGIVKISSNKGKTYPENVEFSNKEFEVERIFTATEASRLIFEVTNKEGENIDEVVLEL